LIIRTKYIPVPSHVLNCMLVFVPDIFIGVGPIVVPMG